MELLTVQQHIVRPEGLHVIELPNDDDPRDLDLVGVDRIDLHFPVFTDGRAHSQAFLLSRRLGFRGELRATGDVLVDQLALLARNGFTHAVLRADQDLLLGAHELDRYDAYYQGDARSHLPHFAREVR